MQVTELDGLKQENEQHKKQIEELTKQLNKKAPSKILVKGKQPKAPEIKIEPKKEIEPEANDNGDLDIATELYN